MSLMAFLLFYMYNDYIRSFQFTEKELRIDLDSVTYT